MRAVWKQKKRKYIAKESKQDSIAQQKNIKQVVAAKTYKPKKSDKHNTSNITRGVWHIDRNNAMIRDKKKRTRSHSHMHKHKSEVYGVYEYDGYGGYYGYHGYDWYNADGAYGAYDANYAEYGSYDAYGGSNPNYKKQRDKRKSTPCIFYQKGVCLKGKACPFKHVSRGGGGGRGGVGGVADDAALLYQVCWNFVSGFCARGKKCRWLHSIPSNKEFMAQSPQESDYKFKRKETGKKSKNSDVAIGPEAEVRPDINIQKFIPRINVYKNKSEFEKAEYLLCCEGLRNNEKILDCHYDSLKWKCAFNYLFFGDKNSNLLNKMDEEIINKNMENHKLRIKFFKLLNKNGVQKTIEIYKKELPDTETKDNESDGDDDVVKQMILERETKGNQSKTNGDELGDRDNKERDSESGGDDDDAKQSEIGIQKKGNDVNAANDEPCW